MNRHTSNPFLAGWEENDDENTTGTKAFDKDATIKGDPESTGRRHSSSQGDGNGNPFANQRSTDRRLYHRNMSSFEAASLQLEQHQQQQLQYNGSLEGNNQTDIIAQMTADFQSAIETNDKTFGAESGIESGFNPFDPFETIVDDDISIPSPATSLNQSVQKSGKFFKSDDEANPQEASNVTRPEGIALETEKRKSTHDSIDDDEDELVSTPVRNIKSSPLRTAGEQSIRVEPQEPNKTTGNDLISSGNDQASNVQVENGTAEDPNTDSITKASLFASLLATAESTGQKQPDSEDTSVEGGREKANTQVSNSEDQSVHSVEIEHTTHVIKGSTSSGDGIVDRPIAFFDPFETVIDKDALTSLMNDSLQTTQAPKSTDISPVDDYAPPTRTPEPTPVHRMHENQELDDSHLHQPANKLKLGLITESTSVETVIENAACRTNTDTGSKDTTTTVAGTSEQTVDESAISNKPIPRPVSSSIRQDQPHQVQSLSEAPKATVSKRANRQKKKSSFQEDSSDSSEEDDRIQIVIKARNASQLDNTSQHKIVPLLPPPPSKSSMKQARERGQVEDMPSPVMSYKIRQERIASDNFQSDSSAPENVENSAKVETGESRKDIVGKPKAPKQKEEDEEEAEPDEDTSDHDRFVIPMTHSDDEDTYGKPDTPLYDEDTSYVLDDFPAKYEGPGWEMMLRYPPKKNLYSNRFWKKIFVKLAQVPLVPDSRSSKQHKEITNEPPETCIALQVFDKPEDKKPMQEIPIQATYTVSEISSQQFDQFGKIFTLKLQYIFYKERVGVRQGQLARFIHTGHIGSSTTSGGHGVDPLSIGAIKRVGAPIEHSPQISQIIKLGCTSYSEIKQFKNCLEDHLFKMPIHRDRALSTYKTEEVQMAVRDETYLELNQVGTVTKQLARVRLFFLSFLNGMPTIEVGINDIHRQGREVVGRMDILPVVTEEWIRLEAWELHSTVEKEEFENPDSRIIKLVPPDATFFELLRFRVRPPRNRELPLQISANMSVTRTKVSINCDVMVPGCVSRKHGQIPCEGIAIKVWIPECWIYFFREEKHFRMGSKKSVNRRPGKVKGIERFLGGGGLQDINDESSLIEVTSGQAKYEHHHHAIVWRAARWPKESQSAYVQNTMKIRLPLTAYDKMPDNFYEYVHVEYTMPATTVSHTTLRSISVNPCDDEPPEKYVKYSAKYEYNVKMRLSVNLGGKSSDTQPEVSPIVIMKQPDLEEDLQREEDSEEEDEVEGENEGQQQQKEEGQR